MTVDLVETTVRESQRVGVGIEKLTREWEWEGVGLPDCGERCLAVCHRRHHRTTLGRRDRLAKRVSPMQQHL